MFFRDRADAGDHLARPLDHLRAAGPVVLGLPRGGVPVAVPVAAALAAPLDVLVVRKLGVPGQPELAMGAVGEGGVVVLEERVLRVARVVDADLARVRDDQQAEVDRRVRLFREVRPRVPLAGRTVVLVDDGIATGSTARAACAVARAQGAARVVLAVPVCSPDAVPALTAATDELVVLSSPPGFRSVGQAYADFRATEDDEVLDLLRRAAQPPV
ncbi:phosphoribosyltransferase [Modestobacter sp. KNN46-3]|uniref:phosphoribosyltransferase n=1 Tax=Modestobacter sp. KNN46-3 TaxID=2711218 RepID=UPI0013E0BB25|nr:phosphoribosyltransferase family protein [Modestobacter sp. KNN46-3]